MMRDSFCGKRSGRIDWRPLLPRSLFVVVRFRLLGAIDEPSQPLHAAIGVVLPPLRIGEPNGSLLERLLGRLGRSPHCGFLSFHGSSVNHILNHKKCVAAAYIVNHNKSESEQRRRTDLRDEERGIKPNKKFETLKERFSNSRTTCRRATQLEMA
jgi:hypothetical protein